MKRTIILYFLFISIPVFSQTEFSRGFQNGYKVGYCYREQGCIPPIPPITPILRIGESQDNYQDGYNRGFKQGLEDKETKRTNSYGSSEVQGNYSAPYLGESSHDPIEFAQRNKAAKQTAPYAQSLYLEKLHEGIKKYELQMEIWEDQIGYDELNEKIIQLRNLFIDCTIKGLDLVTPSNSDELKLYDAFNEAMVNLRSKHNVWQTQKLAYHEAEKIILEQLVKPESERTINIESTKENMRILLCTPGILNRSKMTDSLIVKSTIEK